MPFIARIICGIFPDKISVVPWNPGPVSILTRQIVMWEQPLLHLEPSIITFCTVQGHSTDCKDSLFLAIHWNASKCPYTHFRSIHTWASAAQSTMSSPPRRTWNKRHVQGSHAQNFNQQLWLEGAAATKKINSGICRCNTRNHCPFILRTSLSYPTEKLETCLSKIKNSLCFLETDKRQWNKNDQSRDYRVKRSLTAYQRLAKQSQYLWSVFRVSQ